MHPSDWSTSLAAAFWPELFLLALLGDWRRAGRGRKLLRRWGVREPTGSQAAEAMRYLRGRWLAYPLLFLPMFVPLAALSGHDLEGSGAASDSGGAVLAAVALTLLLGGAAADLARSRIRDPAVHGALFDRVRVPGWGAALYLLLAVGTVVLGILDVRAAPYLPVVLAGVQTSENTSGPPLWIPLAATALCLFALGATRAVTSRRSLADDRTVDHALRTRSARIALSLASGAQTMVMSLACRRMNLVHDLHFGHAALPSWLVTMSQDVHVTQMVLASAGLIGWLVLAITPCRR